MLLLLLLLHDSTRPNTVNSGHRLAAREPMTRHFDALLLLRSKQQ